MIDFHADELSPRRLIVLPWLIYAIVAALLVVGVMKCAQADEVFRNKDRSGAPIALRITDKPCTDAKVLAWLYERFLDERRFRASVLTWQGQDWPSCYLEKDGEVLSVDSEGSQFQPVPREKFRDESI